MMSPEGGGSAPGHAHHGAGWPSSSVDVDAPEGFVAQLAAVLDAYFDVWLALSSDDLSAARTDAGEVASALSQVDTDLLSPQSHTAWMPLARALGDGASAISGAEGIEAARSAFALLSESMYSALTAFGAPGEGAVYRMHCPMSFDGRGADWLQDAADVRNPYFGSVMFRCGDMVETVRSSGAHDHD